MARLWHRELRRPKKTDAENGVLFKQMFDIPELAEAILLNLPMRDLLLLQRVSKHWKAIIDNSPRLQQALFFRPIAPSIPSSPDTSTHPGWNNRKPIFHHPIIRWQYSRPARNLKFNLHSVRDRPEASWRRQFLTQPPVEKALLWSYPGPIKEVNASMIGVTFGDAWKASDGFAVFSFEGDNRREEHEIEWDYLPTHDVISAAKERIYEAS